MATNSNNTSQATTQQYLDIHDITNDLLILRNGAVSMVLQVNALNFGLLSEPEQDAIIYAYAALINSLSFPIQIVIKSSPKDVTRYLEYIDEQQQQASSELRRRQIASYRQFVSNLITEQNVLDKNFYVVLPLTALELGVNDELNPLNSISQTKKEPQFDKYKLVEKAKNILIPRRDHILAQFGRIGLLAKQLSTKELIHVFYTAYNVEAAEGARVVDTKEYTSPVIQAQATINKPDFQTSTPAKNSAAVPTPTATPPSVPESPATPSPPLGTTAAPVNVSTGPTNSTVTDTSPNLENVSAIPQESFATQNQNQLPVQNQNTATGKKPR